MAKTMKAAPACPTCAEAAPMSRRRGATDKEYARAFDRENPTSLPHNCDTASPEQRATLGDLYVCDECGYKTRVLAAAPADDQGVGN